MIENLIQRSFFPLMRVGLWCLTYYFLIGIFQIVPLIFYDVSFASLKTANVPIQVHLLMSLLSLVITLLFYFYLAKKNYFPKINFSKIRGLFTGFIFGAVVVSIIFLLVITIDGLKFFFNDGFLLTQSAKTCALFLFVSISEEIFNRGIVLRYLVQTQNGENTSILISAAIFTAVHAINPNVQVIGLINIFLAGVVLSQLFIYFNFNLWLAIGLHWSWNFIQGAVYGFAVSGINVESIFNPVVNVNTLFNGGDFGLEGSILTLFVMAALVVLLYYFKNKKVQHITSRQLIYNS